MQFLQSLFYMFSAKHVLHYNVKSELNPAFRTLHTIPQQISAPSIPHFTFRIPHSTIPNYTWTSQGASSFELVRLALCEYDIVGYTHGRPCA